MALIKQRVSIPFAEGLDTKTDRQQEALGSFRVLENVIFETINKLRKRRGYDQIQTLELGTESRITDAKQITNFKDELCLINETDFYSRSNVTEKWTNKGKIFSAFPTSTSVIRDNFSHSNTDCLQLEGLNVFTYEDSEGVKLSVKDSESGNYLVSNTLISAAGTLPKVSHISNNVFVFYVDGINIKYRRFNIIDPTVIESEKTVISNMDATNKKYDVELISQKIFVTYNSATAGGTLSFVKVNEDDTISSIVEVAGEVPSHALSLHTDINSRVLATWSDNVDIKVMAFNFTLGVQIIAPTSIETIAGITNTCLIEADNGYYDVFYEVSAGISKDYYVKYNTIDLSATIGTPSIVLKSVGLASKPFRHNNITFITTVHESTLQSTYFVTDTSGDIITKINTDVAGGLVADNGVTKVPQISDDEFLIAGQIKGRTVEDSDTFFSLLGINATILNFDKKDPYTNEVQGANLHITGGYLQAYDGNETVEHGFHVFPEDLINDSTATVGGFLSDGTYQYAAVYTWTDNQGQQHKSAPSIGFEVILAGGTATQIQNIDVPSLRLTDKTNVILDLYRTEDAGTVFYKVSDTFNPTYNDKTVEVVTILDTTSDTDLINNEILYTTGGVLDNIAAPSSSIITSFGNRIVLAGLEDESKLIYSKIRFEEQPIEFNDSLTVNVKADGGAITALKAMDEKLIIFKEEAIYYMLGDGPNNLGEQDNFTEPELVSSEIGCIEVNSVVLTPLGLFFKSKKGIYLVNRSMQLAYVGAPVEFYNNLTISSAVTIPQENQVRFTTTDGDALVYNYFTNKWATFTNHLALSATSIGSDYYFLRSDGVIYKENLDKFSDNGSPINIKLSTGWISFAGVQGFQRVYKLFLLGQFRSEHKIRIRIAYDFNEAYIQEKIIDTSDFTDSNAYGDYSPYGEPEITPYGGEGNVYQLRLDLKKQKCQSIKIRIEEIQHTTPGEGLTLSNVAFEVGAKKGMFKPDKERKYGTE